MFTFPIRKVFTTSRARLPFSLWERYIEKQNDWLGEKKAEPPCDNVITLWGVQKSKYRTNYQQKYQNENLWKNLFDVNKYTEGYTFTMKDLS